MELQYRGSGKVYFNEKEYKCDLYYNEKLGGIILKINVKNEKMLGDFLEVPLEIPYLYGQLENGFIFTLLKLNRIGMQDLVSYGMSVYTFNVDYILCGIGGSLNMNKPFVNWSSHYQILYNGQENQFLLLVKIMNYLKRRKK